MKILLIYNSGIITNGKDCLIENHVGQFAKELKNLGNEVTFFGQKVMSNENVVEIFPILENELKLIALKRNRNKIVNYLMLHLLAIYAVFKSEFIYLFYPNAFKYVAFISIILNRKFGLYIRGMEDLEDIASIYLYKKAKVIFTVSPYFSELVNSYIGKPIANSIRPMIPFTEKDIIRNRVYSNKDKFTLLYVGRIVDDKGLDELLHALFALKKNKINCHLNIIGAGDYLEHINQLALKLNLIDRISIIGKIFNLTELKSYYEKSDIFISPSYHEGFPRTIYEAMIFGLPVVTTPVGGIPAIMKDTFNCRTIKVRSVDDIVRVLSELISNYSQVAELVDNARQTVLPIINSSNPSHAVQLINALIGKAKSE